MKRLLAIAAIALPLSAAQAQEAIRFVACPVYRDTDAGRKSGCWLATDPATGTQWDVSQSPHKPDWNFAVLVEGIPAADPAQPCGARVLEPARTSRLDQPCVRHMLPAEGFAGRPFVLPPRNNQPLFAQQPVPPGPYAERTFTIFFEYDRDFLVYQYGDYLLDQAQQWIAAARPARLVVTAFAATDPVEISGYTLAERPAVAGERAWVIAESLRRLHPAIPVETRTITGSQPNGHADADGIPWQSQRRVEITALFD